MNKMETPKKYIFGGKKMTWVKIDGAWMNLDVFKEIRVVEIKYGQFGVMGIHNDRGSYEISSKVFKTRLEAHNYLNKMMDKAINGMD